MHHMTMHMDDNFYGLFSAYWWLLIPFFIGIFRLIRLILEHKRASHALEVMKAYTDQGKEVPPDLIRVLQQPDRSARRYGEPRMGFTMVGLLCAVMAAAFAVLLVTKGIMEGEHDVTAGLSFVVMMFVGFAGTFLWMGHLRGKDTRLDPP